MHFHQRSSFLTRQTVSCLVFVIYVRILEYLCLDIISKEKWTVSDVWDTVQTMASVQTEKLQQHKFGT